MNELVKKIREFQNRTNRFDATRWLLLNADTIVEALEAAEKLPRTLDGKMFLPGMELFYIYAVKSHAWVDHAWVGIAHSIDPRYCYSSREAAEMAMAGQRSVTP